MSRETLWLILGFGGQLLFFMRFFVQWIASERRKISVIPRAFWFFSLGGGLTLLSYAFYRRDPVFIAGQLSGGFIYSRNLWFIYRPQAAGGPPDGPRMAGGQTPPPDS